jgi:outer membrane protein insertion porin family
VEAIAFGLSHPFIGSDWSFQTLDIDVRRYLAVARHHIIAGRLLYRQSFGEAPFFYQPDFGGSELGRGFLPDRFIGRVGLYGQLEYRFPIVSILDGVLFADAGQVAGTVRELAWDGFQLCGGAGLRLAFSESSILALDLGLNGAPLSRGGYFLAFRSSNAF